MGIWIVLASLLVNCFLLGLLLAPSLRPHDHMPFGPPGDLLEHLSRGLPPADADILRAVFDKEEQDFDSNHENIEAAMRELSTALQKPVVDQQGLHKAVSDISAVHAKMDDTMSRLIEDAAAHMSPEGRRAFVRNGLHPPGPPGPPPDMDRPPPD
jgi:uncharacterized membrane protein